MKKMIDIAKNLFEPLHRVESISLVDFENKFALPQVPVIIEKMSLQWPAYTTWTLDNFVNRFGHIFIQVTKSSDLSLKSTTLRDYVSYMRNTTEEHAYYFKNWEFEDSVPELRYEYEVLPHFASWLDTLPVELQPKFKWIYIGPNKSYSKMHLDIFKTNAWNILFEGKKLWLFFGPEQQQMLSQNQFHPDFPGYMFPNATGLKGFYAIQNHGEIVFTPGSWFHQVYNLEDTLALTENYVNHTNYKVVENHLREFGNDQMLSVMQSLKKSLLTPGY